jgi:hypothetical protein
MTHKSDHLTREYSRCRSGNKCIYGFPRPFTPNTWVDDDGRIHYQCLTDADRWISPHIPELVDELECHIYVDVVFTVSVFTYLYKYLYKGPDQTRFTISAPGDEESVDEITEYVNARYLCSPECAWRIIGFDITSKKPSVDCLPVHLPEGNIPRFSGKPQDASPSASPLIRYFNRPKLRAFDNLTYIDYFQNFILYKWNEDEALQHGETLEELIPSSNRHKVCPRQRGIKVVRIQIISPTAGELFYLRCLLTHLPARTYRDLCTVDNVLYDSFHDAALHLGLFTDQNEGYYALLEAVTSYHTPAQLRFLFTRLILEGYPALPLWTDFREDLARDCIQRLHSIERGVDETLQLISDSISDSGRCLSDYGLPEPLFRTTEVVEELETYNHRLCELKDAAGQMHASMNEEQIEIYDRILPTILDRQSHPEIPVSPSFIEGRPGRGKTFLVDALCCDLRSRNLIVLVVGTSALAATLYEGGRTAHNLFGIPVTDVRAPSFVSSPRAP